MKNSSKINIAVFSLLIVAGFIIGYVVMFETQNFRGAESLDKNRPSVDRWLKGGRSKDEVLRKFGPPHNQRTEKVWVWLLGRQLPEPNSTIPVAQLEYKCDGFWLQFSHDETVGPLRSISGEFEDFEQAIQGDYQ